MRAEMYALHDALEERHWWFAGRREIVLGLLRASLPEGGRPRILEIGCGTGGMLAHLAELGEAAGCDPSPAAVERARRKSAADVRPGSLPDDVPFPPGRWDVVALLDVLEHVADDRAALRAVRALLRPGGLLVCTVPAFPFLWSGHDVANEHRRRYTRPELVGKLAEGGFSVEKASYFNTLLFPGIAAVRIVRKLLRVKDEGGDLAPVPGPLNGVLRRVFAAEKRVLHTGTLPFGVSLLALARRPGE